MATRMKTKTCSRCRQDKDVDLFFRRAERGDGLAGYSGRCKECEYEVRRARYEDDPTVVLRARKNYFQKNRDAVYKRNHAWRTRKRRELIDLLGGKCERCGFDDIRALQVDHVNGGGASHRRDDPTVVSVGGLYKAVVDNPDDFAVLCANCNWIKRAENEEYAK